MKWIFIHLLGVLFAMSGVAHAQSDYPTSNEASLEPDQLRNELNEVVNDSQSLGDLPVTTDASVPDKITTEPENENKIADTSTLPPPQVDFNAPEPAPTANWIEESVSNQAAAPSKTNSNATDNLTTTTQNEEPKVTSPEIPPTKSSRVRGRELTSTNTPVSEDALLQAENIESKSSLKSSARKRQR